MMMKNHMEKDRSEDCCSYLCEKSTISLNDVYLQRFPRRGVYVGSPLPSLSESLVTGVGAEYESGSRSVSTVCVELGLDPLPSPE